jgi:Tol biopolymer transport system component
VTQITHDGHFRYPPDIAWSPDGQRFVYPVPHPSRLITDTVSGVAKTMLAGQELWLYDRRTGAREKLADNGELPRWSADDRFLLFDSPDIMDNWLEVLDLASPQVTRLGSSFGRQDWLGADRVIGVGADMRPFAVDRRGGTPSPLPAAQPFRLDGPLTFAVSPDGRWIALVYGGELWLAPADRPDRRTLLSSRVANVEGGLAWSPQSDRLAFNDGSSEGNPLPWTLVVARVADPAHPQAIYQTQQGISNITWSPDGNALAFDGESPSEGPVGVMVVDADGSGQPRLLLAAADGSDPDSCGSGAIPYGAHWSPDGSAMVVQMGVDEGHTNLWLATLLPAPSSTASPVAPSPTEPLTPTVAPAITATVAPTASAAIVYRAEAIRVAGMQQLTHDGAFHSPLEIAWSPAGDRLVFPMRNGCRPAVSPRGANEILDPKQLWLYDRRTGGREKLTDNGELPKWSADGRYLLFGARTLGLNDEELKVLDLASRQVIQVGSSYLWRHGWLGTDRVIGVGADLRPFAVDRRGGTPSPLPAAQSPRLDGRQGSAMSPDGRWIVLVEGETLWLARADRPDQRTRLTDLFDSAGGGPVWSPQSDKLAYSEITTSNDAGHLTSRLMVARPAAPTLQRAIYRSDRPVGDLSWSPDGNVLAFDGPSPEDGRTAVMLANADGGTPARVLIPTGLGSDDIPRGTHWSPDGSSMVIQIGPEQGKMNLWLVTLSLATPPAAPSPAPAATVATPVTATPVYRADAIRLAGMQQITHDGHVRYPPNIAWSPDGQRFVYPIPLPARLITDTPPGVAKTMRAPQELWLYDRQTGAREKLADNGVQPKWSADGRSLLFGSPDTTVNWLEVLDLASRKVTRLGSSFYWHDWLDADRVIGVGADLRPFVVDRRGGTPSPLPAAQPFQLNKPLAFAVSPDGRWIALADEPNLWLAPVDRPDQRTLLSTGFANVLGGLAWSPGSDKLAYNDGSSWLATSTVTLAVVRVADPAHPQAIYQKHHETSGITWSPDGNALAFDGGSQRDGQPGIMVANADGSGRPRLLIPAGPGMDDFVSGAQWSPDGSAILVQVGTGTAGGDLWLASLSLDAAGGGQ